MEIINDWRLSPVCFVVCDISYVKGCSIFYNPLVREFFNDNYNYSMFHLIPLVSIVILLVINLCNLHAQYTRSLGCLLLMGGCNKHPVHFVQPIVQYSPFWKKQCAYAREAPRIWRWGGSMHWKMGGGNTVKTLTIE